MHGKINENSLCQTQKLFQNATFAIGCVATSMEQGSHVQFSRINRMLIELKQINRGFPLLLHFASKNFGSNVVSQLRLNVFHIIGTF